MKEIQTELTTEEIVKFKIIEFNKFNNGDDSDCIAVLENGKKIRVDPFVGCAYEYENRINLTGEWFEAEGHWYEDLKNNCSKCFLPSEGKMRILKTTNLK